jgi:thioredoxin
MSDKVVKITDRNFEETVLGSAKPSVVDFWATWCVPCKRLDEVLEEMAEAYDGRVSFYKVDVNESSGTASKFAVWSIPMLLFFHGGEVVDQAVGSLSREAIQEKLNKLLGYA